MFILPEVTESIGTIILNRPEKRNALSHALIDEALATLAEFQNSRVRVVVLTATVAGGVWSEGHDITELPEGEEVFERIQYLRRHVYSSADYLEGIRAFHEKRKPAFAGR